MQRFETFGNFNLKDDDWKTFNCTEKSDLDELLDENPTQTQEELAEKLGITRQAVNHPTETIG